MRIKFVENFYPNRSSDAVRIAAFFAALAADFDHSLMSKNCRQKRRKTAPTAGMMTDLSLTKQLVKDKFSRSAMNRILYNISVAAASLTLLAGSCSSTSSNKAQAASDEQPTVTAAPFNADSAYAYVAAQCAFGERVPNTEAHRRCGDYLAAKLQQFGAAVTEQTAEIKAFDGTTLHMRNIIGSYNPDAERRVLLLAHWDCRPWADNDPDPSNHTKPVMGANDGASGVGVLIEIARQLQAKSANVGVDIMLVDDEDWGDSTAADEESWALGTQYWTENMHVRGYRPAFGILLDMVGAADATFYKEFYSMRYANGVVQEVWNTAKQIGYGSVFKDKQGGAITDDHVFVNRAGIPCIDIIDTRNDGNGGFFPYWHTVDDTMQHIDPATLKAVGATVLTTIYSM